MVVYGYAGSFMIRTLHMVNHFRSIILFSDISYNNSYPKFCISGHCSAISTCQHLTG